jgi:6-phosphogluconolactonase/glucosamine-6-phosphate isomerase/deaminase
MARWKKHIFNYDEIRVPYESTERIKHASKKVILKNLMIKEDYMAKFDIL